MWIAQHRLAVALVAVAAFATVGVFTFARPAYHRPNHGGVELKFPEAVPPSHGWRWDDPTPGFHIGEDGDKWNLSLLRPREIPRGAGILTAARFAPHEAPELIYSKPGCVGVQLAMGRRRLLCPPRAEVVVLAYARAPEPGEGRLDPLFVTGIARSDVARVTVEAPREAGIDDRTGTPVVRKLGPRVAYQSSWRSWWGTFSIEVSQPGGWDAMVTVRDKRGRVSRVRVHLAHTGDRVYCAGGAVSCR